MSSQKLKPGDNVWFQNGPEGLRYFGTILRRKTWRGVHGFIVETASRWEWASPFMLTPANNRPKP